MEPHAGRNDILNAFYIYFRELLSKILSIKSQNLKKEILYNQLLKWLNLDVFWEWELFLLTFCAHLLHWRMSVWAYQVYMGATSIILLPTELWYM